MPTVQATVAANGRLVIPLDLRRALGIEDGGEVFLELDEQELKITSRVHQAAAAQAKVRSYLKGEKNLAEELIAERREAAKSE
jgi:antitoxin PrlF